MENTNVTLREVAQRVGVSMVSVSRALSGKEGVSEATRKRILETAEEMGYTANLAASVLKKKRATVAIILPEAQNAGFTILSEELGAEQYGIAFRADDKELCSSIEGAVKTLVDNGTYAKIAEKYPDIVNNLLFLN